MHIILNAYNICIEIEWDPNKAAINREKHGVRFSDAEAVLFDPNALSMEDETAEGFCEMLFCRSRW